MPAGIQAAITPPGGPQLEMCALPGTYGLIAVLALPLGREARVPHLSQSGSLM